jgi:hypothetical protein
MGVRRHRAACGSSTTTLCHRRGDPQRGNARTERPAASAAAGHVSSASDSCQGKPRNIGSPFSRLVCIFIHLSSARLMPAHAAMKVIGNQSYEGIHRHSSQAAVPMPGVPPCTAADGRVCVRVDRLWCQTAPRGRNLQLRRLPATGGKASLPGRRQLSHRVMGYLVPPWPR